MHAEGEVERLCLEISYAQPDTSQHGIQGREEARVGIQKMNCAKENRHEYRRTNCSHSLDQCLKWIPAENQFLPHREICEEDETEPKVPHEHSEVLTGHQVQFDSSDCQHYTADKPNHHGTHQKSEQQFLEYLPVVRHSHRTKLPPVNKLQHEISRKDDVDIEKEEERLKRDNSRQLGESRREIVKDQDGHQKKGHAPPTSQVVFVIEKKIVIRRQLVRELLHDQSRHQCEYAEKQAEQEPIPLVSVLSADSICREGGRGNLIHEDIKPIFGNEFNWTHLGLR